MPLKRLKSARAGIRLRCVRVALTLHTGPMRRHLIQSWCCVPLVYLCAATRVYYDLYEDGRLQYTLKVGGPTP